MHAAWCLTHVPELASHHGEALREAAGSLAQVASELTVGSERFWDQLLTLSFDVRQNRGLAERLLVRLVPEAARSESRISQLTGAIASVESVFARRFPNYEADVRLRAEPLRQLWEAHGPGLLRLVGRFTDPGLIVERASVVLVQPMIGGAGYAHLQTNRVHMEAVLTNCDPQLTETVRLAWLLSQLDFERPVYSELIHRDRLRQMAGLATIPAVLLAAQELDICALSVEQVAAAVRLWRVSEMRPGEAAAESALADVLMTWWETYQASRPEWRIALTGLDRMLGDADQ